MKCLEQCLVGTKHLLTTGIMMSNVVKVVQSNNTQEFDSTQKFRPLRGSLLQRALVKKHFVQLIASDADLPSWLNDRIPADKTWGRISAIEGEMQKCKWARKFHHVQEKYIILI